MEARLTHKVEDDRFGCLLSQPFLFLQQGLILLDESVGRRQVVK